MPANEIVGLRPGELFVHRNVANLVPPADLNCLSVVQYAVDILKIRHIIVCGHYGCGGVQAVLENRASGLSGIWLSPIQELARRHRSELDVLDLAARCDRLCEINVLEQVCNVGGSTIVQHAWQLGQPLTLHGWIYDIRDGLLKDLGIRVDSPVGLAGVQR